jgi:hypothetical protein
MTTLEEEIKHCEEVAESYEQQVKDETWVKGSFSELRCIECASEHRQLAEWLRELKMYREILKTGNVRGCRNCKNKYYDSEDFPCNDCDNCEHWELMEVKE